MGRRTTLVVSGCGRYDRSEEQPAASGPTERASPIRQARPVNEAIRDMVVPSSIGSDRQLETSHLSEEPCCWIEESSPSRVTDGGGTPISCQRRDSHIDSHRSAAHAGALGTCVLAGRI